MIIRPMSQIVLDTVCQNILPKWIKTNKTNNSVKNTKKKNDKNRKSEEELLKMLGKTRKTCRV